MLLQVHIIVNGKRETFQTMPMRRLLDILRDDMKLTGTKEGCGEGECGACSVLMDGQLVNSCIIPIHRANGSEIITIEGMRSSRAGQLLAQCFAEAHSAQCGFCTPGMAMASISLLRCKPKPTEKEIRENLAGNICRCTGYDMIVDGIQLAAERAEKEGLDWKKL